MRWGDDEQFRRCSFSLAFFISISPPFFFSPFFFLFFLQRHFWSGADFVWDHRVTPDLPGGQEYGARASQLGAFDEAALRNLI